MDSTAVDVNEIRLEGRVSHVEEERELPSGDTVRTLRVVVTRPPAARRPRDGAAAGGRPRTVVDTLDIACWSARTRRTAASLNVGDRVSVTGSLRRRFFRTGAGPTSRHEVEAATLRRTERAAGPGRSKRGAATPAETPT